MTRRSRGSWASKAGLDLFLVLSTAIVGLLAAGCSTSNHTSQQHVFLRVVSPRPPAALIGPLSVLLTNGTGFSAQAELRAPDSMDPDQSSSGQLFGRGTQLLYAPITDESTDTHRKPGRYSYIWDVAQSRGFVLSDALQAYAPISSVAVVTNLSFLAGQASAQKVSGHPCEPAVATVQMSDGTAVQFQVLRALDLKGFPVQIERATNRVATLILSKIRLEQPPTELFSPPDGFAKYPTPEAMADELAARQNNLRRRSSDQLPYLPGMQPGSP